MFKIISVGGLGVKVLDIHTSGKAHQEKEAISTKQCQLILPVNVDDYQTSSQSSITFSSQQTVDGMIIKQETIKAEIMWTLEVLISNHFFRSCEEKSSSQLCFQIVK